MNKKFLAVAIALLIGGAMSVDAQGILNRIGNRIKNRVEDKVNQTVDRTVDGAVNGAVDEVTRPGDEDETPVEAETPGTDEAPVTADAGAVKKDTEVFVGDKKVE